VAARGACAAVGEAGGREALAPDDAHELEAAE